ncbi:DUF1328 domain-containing protein [Pseudooctadecabacter sp.]|uniref:DUF1328 domain-containing protein n=1 Tax=Pseudooctadecabacter sp. TaxID=1966338 RepID=UPI0035C86568
MRKWVVTFFGAALIAGVFAFSENLASWSDVGLVLFVVFAALFVVSLTTYFLRR